MVQKFFPPTAHKVLEINTSEFWAEFSVVGMIFDAKVPKLIVKLREERMAHDGVSWQVMRDTLNLLTTSSRM